MASVIVSTRQIMICLHFAINHDDLFDLGYPFQKKKPQFPGRPGGFCLGSHLKIDITRLLPFAHRKPAETDRPIEKIKANLIVVTYLSDSVTKTDSTVYNVARKLS